MALVPCCCIQRERERERESGGWYNDADMVVQGSGIRTQALWTEMNRLLVSEISEIESSTWVYSGVAAIDTLVIAFIKGQIARLLLF